MPYRITQQLLPEESQFDFRACSDRAQNKEQNHEQDEEEPADRFPCRRAGHGAALGMGLVNVASADVHHYAPQHVSVGWHGERYWDGHRYWERKE